jgi:hypothetical protein
VARLAGVPEEEFEAALNAPCNKAEALRAYARQQYRGKA